MSEKVRITELDDSDGLMTTNADGEIQIDKAELDTMIDEAYERAVAEQATDDETAGEASVESLLPAAIADNSPLSVEMLEGEPEGLLIELGELFVGGFSANARSEEQRLVLEPIEIESGVGMVDVEAARGSRTDSDDVTANTDERDADGDDIGTGRIDDIIQKHRGIY